MATFREKLEKAIENQRQLAERHWAECRRLSGDGYWIAYGRIHNKGEFGELCTPELVIESGSLNYALTLQALRSVSGSKNYSDIKRVIDRFRDLRWRNNCHFQSGVMSLLHVASEVAKL